MRWQINVFASGFTIGLFMVCAKLSVAHTPRFTFHRWLQKAFSNIKMWCFLTKTYAKWMSIRKIQTAFSWLCPVFSWFCLSLQVIFLSFQLHFMYYALKMASFHIDIWWKRIADVWDMIVSEEATIGSKYQPISNYLRLSASFLFLSSKK